MCFYADFVPLSITIDNNSTTNHVCSVISSNDNTNNATIFVTSTTDVIISSTSDHPFSGSTPIITNNATNNSDYLSSRPVIAYRVILSSVGGGLLGSCIMLCIVGLLVKRKPTRKHKIKTGTFSPVNSRYALN